jgi:hypothetical protein
MSANVGQPVNCQEALHHSWAPGKSFVALLTTPALSNRTGFASVPLGVGDPGVDQAGKEGGIATRFHSCLRRALLLGVTAALALLILVKLMVDESMMVLSRSTCSRDNSAARQGGTSRGQYYFWQLRREWPIVMCTDGTKNVQPTEQCSAKIEADVQR